MAPSVVERQCVVCGAKSHRSDWQQAQYPACDFHSKAEVQGAIAKLTNPTGAAPTTKAATQ